MTLASRTTSAIVEFVGVDYRVGRFTVNHTDRRTDRPPRRDDVRLPLARRPFGGRNDFAALSVAEIR
jgi:hypothetical protein